MIKNGKDTALNTISGTVPNVSGAMSNWHQKLTFTKLVTTIDGYRTKTVETAFSFQGVMQPMKAQELEYKPQGQRAWKWWKCHALVNLFLKVDDIILYNGVKFRVKAVNNYDIYGYYEYDLVEGYVDAVAE